MRARRSLVALVASATLVSSLFTTVASVARAQYPGETSPQGERGAPVVSAGTVPLRLRAAGGEPRYELTDGDHIVAQCAEDCVVPVYPGHYQLRVLDGKRASLHFVDVGGATDVTFHPREVATRNMGIVLTSAGGGLTLVGLLGMLITSICIDGCSQSQHDAEHGWQIFTGAMAITTVVGIVFLAQGPTPSSIDVDHPRAPTVPERGVASIRFGVAPTTNGAAFALSGAF